MSDKHESMSVFEQLKAGLEDSIAYSKGELSLNTTELPAPPPKAPPQIVLRIRKRLHMSQALFAATLNVSPKTVQSWEQGTREPSDAALRFLQVIQAQPSIVTTILRQPRSARHSAKPVGASARRTRKSRRHVAVLK